MAVKLIVYITAGLGAGIGTGLAGLSAAAVISPMLITLLMVLLTKINIIGCTKIITPFIIAGIISPETINKTVAIPNNVNVIILTIFPVFSLMRIYFVHLKHLFCNLYHYEAFYCEEAAYGILRKERKKECPKRNQLHEVNQ